MIGYIINPRCVHALFRHIQPSGKYRQGSTFDLVLLGVHQCIYEEDAIVEHGYDSSGKSSLPLTTITV